MRSQPVVRRSLPALEALECRRLLSAPGLLSGLSLPLLTPLTTSVSAIATEFASVAASTSPSEHPATHGLGLSVHLNLNLPLFNQVSVDTSLSVNPGSVLAPESGSLLQLSLGADLGLSSSVANATTSVTATALPAVAPPSGNGNVIDVPVTAAIPSLSISVAVETPILVPVNPTVENAPDLAVRPVSPSAQTPVFVATPTPPVARLLSPQTSVALEPNGHTQPVVTPSTTRAQPETEKPATLSPTVAQTTARELSSGEEGQGAHEVSPVIAQASQSQPDRAPDLEWNRPTTVTPLFLTWRGNTVPDSFLWNAPVDWSPARELRVLDESAPPADPPEQPTAPEAEGTGLLTEFHPAGDGFQTSLDGLFQQFNTLGETVHSWLLRLGISPWILGVVTAALVTEYARRRLQRQTQRDGETEPVLAGDSPFLLADGDALDLLTNQQRQQGSLDPR